MPPPGVWFLLVWVICVSMTINNFLTFPTTRTYDHPNPLTRWLYRAMLTIALYIFGFPLAALIVDSSRDILRPQMVPIAIWTTSALVTVALANAYVRLLRWFQSGHQRDKTRNNHMP